MENKACVIIPLKEYNALKERIKELERDHPDIDIEWGGIHMKDMDTSILTEASLPYQKVYTLK